MKKHLLVLVVLAFAILTSPQHVGAQTVAEGESASEIFLERYSWGEIYPDQIENLVLMVDRNDPRGNTKLAVLGCRYIMDDVIQKHFSSGPAIKHVEVRSLPDPKTALLMVVEDLQFAPVPPPTLPMTAIAV